MTKRWIPLSARGKNQETFEVLCEGVPDYLRTSLHEWLTAMVYRDRNETINSDPGLRRKVLLQFERTARRKLPWQIDDDDTWRAIEVELHESSDFTLDLVDFILDGAIRYSAEADALQYILKDAGSEWKVVITDDKHSSTWRFGLEKRVAGSIVEVFKGVAGDTGRAGEHLSKAWRLIYGRHPDPNLAFAESVKAVEAAMVPVVAPNDTMATLGRMLGIVKKNPAMLIIDMSPDENAINPFDVMHGMCQLLWKSQAERHGTPDERERTNVTQRSAEGAVHLAATLVQWFTSGVVRRS